MDRDIGKPLFDLFLIIASGVGFYYSTTLPAVASAGGITPAFFPKLLSGMIFIFAIPCLIRDSLEWLSAARKDEPRCESLRTKISKKGALQWLYMVMLTIGYAAVFEGFGYLASTSLFCFLSVAGMVVLSGEFFRMGAGRKLMAMLIYLVFSVALSSSIYFVFTYLFNIPLPN